jgi:hypothetical protein
MPLAAQNHHSVENEEVPIILAITEEGYRESKKETAGNRKLSRVGRIDNPKRTLD